MLNHFCTWLASLFAGGTLAFFAGASTAAPLILNNQVFSDGCLVNATSSFSSISRMQGICFADDGQFTDYRPGGPQPGIAGLVQHRTALLGPSNQSLFERFVFTDNVVRNGPGDDVVIWEGFGVNVRLALFPGDTPIIGGLDGMVSTPGPGNVFESFLPGSGAITTQLSYDLSDLGVPFGDFVTELWVDVPGLPGGGRPNANIFTVAALYPTAVPLPATGLLLIAGIAVLAGAARRRKT